MSLDPAGRSWVRMSEMMNLAPCWDAGSVSLALCQGERRRAGLVGVALWLRRVAWTREGIEPEGV
jgi:hypothetical protein